MVPHIFDDRFLNYNLFANLNLNEGWIMKRVYDVAVLGGLGHVGLPLGISFASKGLKVCLVDIDKAKAQQVSKGEIPFVEHGAEPLLKNALKKKLLSVSLELSDISKAEYVIITLGTPIDQYMNPKVREFMEFFGKVAEHLDEKQTIIVRSTVYPRTCDQMFKKLGKGKWKLAYCPERIVQGYAIRELVEIPQLVSGYSDEAIESATDLFSKLSPKVIRTTVREAELSKLFANAWRYIQFATANQFYMISNRFGVDFNTVRKAMVDSYPRTVGLPGPGFAAGPCLLKDTMQLAVSTGNNFQLGHSAMLINEGLPNYIVDMLLGEEDLHGKKVGILGMAFKANVDDIRDSLSYKLGKVLRFHGADVHYTDEFAKDPTFIPAQELMDKCDIVIVGAPHSTYRKLKIPEGTRVIDLWSLFGK